MSGSPSHRKSLFLLRGIRYHNCGRIQLMCYGVRRGREEEAMVQSDIPAVLEASSLPLDAHLSLPLPCWTLRDPGYWSHSELSFSASAKGVRFSFLFLIYEALFFVFKHAWLLLSRWVWLTHLRDTAHCSVPGSPDGCPASSCPAVCSHDPLKAFL